MGKIINQNVLLNCRLLDIKRTLDLVMFTFENSIGEKVFLHALCGIRVFNSNRLIISSWDMYRPGKEVGNKKFRWDMVGTSLFDDEVKSHQTLLSSSKVTSCLLLSNKDLVITFDNVYRLELLVDTTASEEKYRLFFDDESRGFFSVDS